jgi:hypothetical protein
MKTCWILLLLFTSTLHAQWTNGQNADFVIGQVDFTTKASTLVISDSTFNFPWGVAVDEVHGKLYVSDFWNNRVLRFAWPVTHNNPKAELVFGQSTFTSNTGGTSATSIVSPHSIAVYKGALWVSDPSNSRVLRYDSAWAKTTNAPAANAVLGQINFTGSSSAVSQSGFYTTFSLCVDTSGNLYVLDENRILIFKNAASKANGANADIVLGQSVFTTKTAATTATGLNYPQAAAVQGTTLYVTEMSNHRTLKYSQASTKTNGAAADGVFGWWNFTSKWNGAMDSLIQYATQVTAYPEGVATNNDGELFVANLSRISIFENADSKPNFSVPEYVLGQENLSVVVNATTEKNFYNTPQDLAYANVSKKLVVADQGNQRVLIFSKGGSTSVKAVDNQPKQITLLQNYPNPFNPSTTIPYQLVKSGHTRLTVLNVLGQKVATLINEEQSAGSHFVVWNASGIASGVYFYRLESGAQTVVKKLVLLR